MKGEGARARVRVRVRAAVGGYGGSALDRGCRVHDSGFRMQGAAGPRLIASPQPRQLPKSPSHCVLSLVVVVAGAEGLGGPAATRGAMADAPLLSYPPAVTNSMTTI